LLDFSSVSDIENSIVEFDFDIDLTWDLSHNLTCYLSIYWTDLDDLTDLISLISDLTDDFTVEASTQSVTCEVEKNFILVSENRDFYV